MYLFTTTRSGVSAKELQRQLGVTYKTAWRMGHEIRKYMGKVDGDSGLSGHVEVDEVYIGGKPRARNNSGYIKGKYTRGDKTIVFGMVERGGDLITRVVPNVKRKTLLPLIDKHVAKGSKISTDEMQTYVVLNNKGYDHGSVHHHEREYVRGETHTNTIEGFWSHFKNSVRGTHKSVSRQHMMNYLHEFEFRFNLRKDVSGSMFDRLIQAF